MGPKSRSSSVSSSANSGSGKDSDSEETKPQKASKAAAETVKAPEAVPVVEKPADASKVKKAVAATSEGDEGEEGSEEESSGSSSGELVQGPSSTASASQPLVLQAEESRLISLDADLSNRASSWIGGVLSESATFVLSRLTSEAHPCVLLEEKAAKKLEGKNGSGQESRTWFCFKALRGGVTVSGSQLASLALSLGDAGLNVQPLFPSVGSSGLLLISAVNIVDAVAALVRAGHVATPIARIAPSLPVVLPQSDGEMLRPYAGAWRLVRAERGQNVAYEFNGSSDDFMIRLQAPGGLFADFRPALAMGQNGESCFGALIIHSGGAGMGGNGVASRLIASSFAPATVIVPPRITASVENAILEEETLGNGKQERLMERWERLPVDPQGVDAGKITALELASEGEKKQRGVWIFCGHRFIRVLGLPRGEGVVGGSACSSIALLQQVKGEQIVQQELREQYDAIVGEVVQPGKLRVLRDVSLSASSRAGKIFFDAEDHSTSGGGSIEVDVEASSVIHKLPSGKIERWCIRDWGSDPFTTPKPPTPSPSPSPQQQADSSEEDKSVEAAEAASDSDETTSERKKKQESDKKKTGGKKLANSSSEPEAKKSPAVGKRRKASKPSVSDVDSGSEADSKSDSSKGGKHSKKKPKTPKSKKPKSKAKSDSEDEEGGEVVLRSSDENSRSEYKDSENERSPSRRKKKEKSRKKGKEDIKEKVRKKLKEKRPEKTKAKDKKDSKNKGREKEVGKSKDKKGGKSDKKSKQRRDRSDEKEKDKDSSKKRGRSKSRGSDRKGKKDRGRMKERRKGKEDKKKRAASDSSASRDAASRSKSPRSSSSSRSPSRSKRKRSGGKSKGRKK